MNCLLTIYLTVKRVKVTVVECLKVIVLRIYNFIARCMLYRHWHNLF